MKLVTLKTLTEFKKKILQEIKLKDYPIGFIYLSAVEIDLNAEFGGTWERIEDTFLLASGSKYAPGSEGGGRNP